MDIEIISESDVVFTRRGRKATYSQELADAIAKGVTLKLPSLAVSVKDETYKTEKAKVSAQIRAAAKASNKSVRIVWTPADKNGNSFPQVLPDKAKTK